MVLAVPQDCKAFRQKMRNDAINAQSVTNSEEYQQHVQLARDIAVFLRRNVVQGTKISDADQSSSETWRTCSLCLNCTPAKLTSF